MGQPPRVWLVLLLSVSAPGCSGSSPSAPTPSTTTTTTPITIGLPTPDKGGHRIPLPPGAGPASLSGVWSGTVGSTAVVEFGGPPYCFYTVQLTDIASLVQISRGIVISAQVTASHTEQSIRGCPYAPIAPNKHTYTLNSAAITDRHISIRYEAWPGNAPTATLDFEGELSSDATSMTGTLTWQRVDQPTAPNLQWKVTADVTMAATP